MTFEKSKYGDIYLARKSSRGLKKPYSKRTLDNIRNFISGNILEIGPGTGDNINLLLNQHIKSYTALEPDERLFEELGNNLRFDVRKSLVSDFFPSKKIQGMTFDTIISFEVIEHTPSPAAFLAECKQLLRPGGNVIISSPNKYIYRTVANLVDGGPDPTHISEMTYLKFRNLFESYFDIIYSNYTLPLFPRISERIGSERLFAASEDIAGIARVLCLNVMLIGTVR